MTKIKTNLELLTKFIDSKTQGNLDLFQLSSNEVLIILVLIRFYNLKEKLAYPSISLLAECSSLSDRTINRVIKSLTEKNVLKIGKIQRSFYEDQKQESLVRPPMYTWRVNSYTFTDKFLEDILTKTNKKVKIEHVL